MTFRNHPETGEKCCPECMGIDFRGGQMGGVEVVACEDCTWWDYL